MKPGAISAVTASSSSSSFVIHSSQTPQEPTSALPLSKESSMSPLPDRDDSYYGSRSNFWDHPSLLDPAESFSSAWVDDAECRNIVRK